MLIDKCTERSRYPSLVSQETVNPFLTKFVPWRWLYIGLVYLYILMNRNLATLTYSNKCWTLHCMHATIPKGNMGYDQYTVPDTVAVKNTFLTSPLVLQTNVLYMASSLKNSELRTTPNTFQYCCVLFFRPVLWLELRRETNNSSS